MFLIFRFVKHVTHHIFRALKHHETKANGRAAVRHRRANASIAAVFIRAGFGFSTRKNPASGVRGERDFGFLFVALSGA